MKTVLLGEVTRSAGPRAGAETRDPVYSVTKYAGFIRSDEYFSKQVYSRDLSNYKRVQTGDFAYATIHLDEGSVGIAPSNGLISPMYTVFRVDADVVDPQYLLRFMKSPRAIAEYSRFGKGSVHRRRSISLQALGNLDIPLPPTEEQRRIAAILDHADALRTKRRQVPTHLDALTQSIFHNMFGGDAGEATPLSAIAQVTSGLTKGRRTSLPTSPVPYLAVSNVQAGHLNLEVVKQIDATATEVDRYALCEGDLVLTEGGDPDKLGRGTVWRGELPICLHQNHIFRVRSDTSLIDPQYLAAYLAARDARRYFLRAAKQTTGIASINSTQLKALPVVVPPMAQQREFAARVERVDAQQAVVQQALAADDELFASLQARAFRGDL